LTKVDADVKGGSALSVTYVTQKPILFIGVGQTYKDLELFNPEKFVNMVLR
jgi:fused signal recognition particle receptor